MLKQRDKRNLAVLLLFALCFLALLWRCFMGFDWSDESFYLATANRFFRGDKLVLDDWNPSGLFSILMLPFFYIYKMCTGSLDGIFVFFRVCYLVISFTVSLFLYHVIHKIHGTKTAAACAVIFLFYVRFSIATFSYNTLAQCFFAVCVIILYQSFCINEFSRSAYLAFGVSISVATVSNPLFAVFYIGMLLTFIILYKTAGDVRKRADYKTVILYSLLPVIISFIAFCFYFFRNISFREFMELLPMLMQADEYAKDAGMIRLILRVPMAILRQYKYTMIPYTLSILYLLWKKYGKKECTDNDIRITWLIQIGILLINIYLSGFGKNTGICFIALTLFGFYIYFIQKKKNYKTIIIWYILGIVSAFLFHFASNTGIYAVASGCLFSAVAVVIACEEVLREYQEAIGKGWNIIKAGTVLGVICIIIVTIFLRLFFVYRDGRIGELTARIDYGPGKGIFTTQTRYQQYEEVYQAIRENTSAGENLLITKLLPWGYLCTEARCAANTTWRVSLDSRRIEEYYQVHPDRFPDTVFIANEDYGVTNNDNMMSAFWESALLSANYEKKEMPCGVFYRAGKKQ